MESAQQFYDQLADSRQPTVYEASSSLEGCSWWESAITTNWCQRTHPGLARRSALEATGSREDVGPTEPPERGTQEACRVRGLHEIEVC